MNNLWIRKVYKRGVYTYENKKTFDYYLINYICMPVHFRCFCGREGNEHGVLPPASIQNEYETNKEKYTDPRRAQGWVQVGNR